MRIISTIEARMNSKRLPGKVLLKSCGTTMLGHLINRLKQVKSIDLIVLATTKNPSDDILYNFASENSIECFRGSENDVMQRVLNAGEKFKADVIVEITADCPLIDPELVEQAISIYKNNNADYVSNCNIRSYPDGMDVQVFSLKTIKKSASLTNDILDREHVTLHIRNNPNLFKHLNIIAPPELNLPNLGLTLDEFEDFKLIDIIINHFSKMNKNFSCLDILNFLKSNPNLFDINKNVSRKGDN